MNVDLIILFSSLLGLVSIFLGMLLIKKRRGGIKTALLFLVLATLSYTTEMTIKFLNLRGYISLISLTDLFSLITGLLLLFTFFSLKFVKW